MLARRAARDSRRWGAGQRKSQALRIVTLDRQAETIEEARVSRPEILELLARLGVAETQGVDRRGRRSAELPGVRRLVGHVTQRGGALRVCHPLPKLA